MPQTPSHNTPRRRNEDNAPLEPMETPLVARDAGTDAVLLLGRTPGGGTLQRGRGTGKVYVLSDAQREEKNRKERAKRAAKKEKENEKEESKKERGRVASQKFRAKKNKENAELQQFYDDRMNASDKDDNDDDLLVLLSAALKVFDDGSTMMKARYMKKMALVAMSREPGAMRSEVAASCSVVIASIHETGKLRAVSLLDYQKLLLTQNMQSSQPVSSWLPPKSVRLGYIAKDLEGYQHEQRLIQDIHELALNALVAMNSEAKEVLMSRDVSASIAKIGQLAVDRTFNHRTLLTRNTQASQPSSPLFPSEKAFLEFIAMDFDGYKNEQTLIRDIYKIALNALVAISCKVIEAPSMKSSEAVEALDAISSEVVAISRDVIASIQKTAQRRETRALELQSLLTQNAHSSHAASDPQHQSA